ncbi:hypothetical protein HanLR1_Chr16g0624991 [Helianthus annuus]|nr:hypothetical protein HanHA89_Chr16g0665331 [Helianthus annuus]KAJ0641243.1 hypothetical protein HanLR1_Chr16g0624991 [Helianthus annuus]
MRQGREYEYRRIRIRTILARTQAWRGNESRGGKDTNTNTKT